MRKRKDGEKTRQKILEAACAVFAEKGFHKATHSEICRRSGVNTALVNYHFKCKETLYKETWRTAFNKSLEKNPVDGGISSDSEPELRMKAWITSLLKRISEGDGKLFEIVHKEMSNPTGLLGDVIEESTGPVRAAISDIIRELLGEEATETHVELCHMSVVAQCFHPLLQKHRHLIINNKKTQKNGFLNKNFTTEEIAKHIIEFSLAGIREIRKQIEKG